MPRGVPTFRTMSQRKAVGQELRLSMRTVGAWMEVGEGVLADVRVLKIFAKRNDPERPLGNQEAICSVPRPHVI